MNSQTTSLGSAFRLLACFTDQSADAKSGCEDAAKVDKGANKNPNNKTILTTVILYICLRLARLEET